MNSKFCEKTQAKNVVRVKMCVEDKVKKLFILISMLLLIPVTAEETNIIISINGSNWEGTKYNYVSYPLHIDSSKLKFVAEEEWDAARIEVKALFKRKHKGLNISKIDFIVDADRSAIRERYKALNSNKYRKFTMTTVQMRKIQKLHETFPKKEKPVVAAKPDKPEDKEKPQGNLAAEKPKENPKEVMKRPVWDLYD